MMMMMERIFERILIAMEEKLELFLVGGIERMRAGTKKCLLVKQSRKKVKKEKKAFENKLVSLFSRKTKSRREMKNFRLNEQETKRRRAFFLLFFMSHVHQFFSTWH